VLLTEEANYYTMKDGSVTQLVFTARDEPFMQNETAPKVVAFIISILNLMVSLLVYILFDFSNNQFQFIQEHYDLSFYDIYLGVDGISIYFVLLTTIIIPIALMSN
jgi:NADH:ubiquinone oxidoreductase subunit 4 (subunit M)